MKRRRRGVPPRRNTKSGPPAISGVLRRGDPGRITSELGRSGADNGTVRSRNADDLASDRMAVVGVRMDRKMLARLDALARKRQGDSWRGPARSMLVTEAVNALLRAEGV